MTVIETWDDVICAPDPRNRRYLPVPTRYCLRCAKRLSRYNANDYCWACVEDGAAITGLNLTGKYGSHR